MKKTYFWTMLIIMVVLLGIVAVGCATVTAIPPDATPEQIEKINAENIAATTKNTGILVGVGIGSASLSALTSLFFLFLILVL